MGTSRRAFSLVEILIAGTVMVAVLIPLMGLMTQRKTDAQSEEGMSEAVALAQDIMEALLSSRVPFASIKPNGGASLVKGGPNGDVAQAGFTDTFLEDLLADGSEAHPGQGGGLCRYKSYKGKTYYTYFFAGKYPLHAALPGNVPADPAYRPPDIDNTLTFAYLEKPSEIGLPWALSPQRNELNRKVVLDVGRIDVGAGVGTVPYTQEPRLVKTGSSPQVVAAAPTDEFFYKDRLKTLGTRRDHRLLSGWPAPMATDPRIQYDIRATADQRAIWAEHLRRVVLRDSGQKATIAYHPMVEDQRALNVRGGGALMKIVVGVQFAPYGFSHDRKNNTFREFWLVSFKANLES